MLCLIYTWLCTSKTVDGATTYYVYDGENIAAEISGGDTTVYLRDNVGIISRTKGNAKEYFVTSYRGDISAVVNSNADIIKSYDYEAFGSLKNASAADDNPFRYCGEYFDDETGFVYLRNRYYDPSIGRFTTEDPVKSGLNWYAYCENNPLKYIDPWGLDVYYFVNAEFRKEADKDKKGLEKLYGEPVHVLETDSRELFIDEWNMMGSWDGKNVDVSLVVINMHGSPDSISAYSDGITGRITVSDMQDGTLIPKYIDNIVFLGCNSGHFDHRYSSLVNKMLVNNTVDSVIASDGTVKNRSIFGRYKSVSDSEFVDKLWSKEKYRKNYGYIRYTKNSKGELEWDILGYNLSVKSMVKKLHIK